MKIQYLGIMSIVVLMLVSCNANRYIYSSPIPNSPILEAAKDASISFQTSGKLLPDINKKRWGGDIQLAYAPINHLALTYSHSYRKERDFFTNNNSLFNTSNVKYNINNHEFAFGFFHTPNRDMRHHKPSDLHYLTYLPPFWIYSIFNNTKVGFSLFGGFGFGGSKITDNGMLKTDTAYNRYFNDRYTKLFIQPTLHFFKNENFSFSFVGKFSHLRFNSVNTNYNTKELSNLQLDNLESRVVGISEFFTNITYKFPELHSLQFQINMGTAWVDNYAYNARGFTASVAVYINPLDLLKKKKVK